MELGFYRTQILFSPSITTPQRNKFKLHLMLADLAFQSSDKHSPYFQQFERLYSDYRHLLTPKQAKRYEEFIDCINQNGTSIDCTKLVRGMRGQSDTEQSSLYSKTPLDPLFNAPSLEAMFAAFSHMLHADAFVIIDLCSPRRSPHRPDLRIYTALVLCGFNVAKHVGIELNNPDINAELQSIEVDVARILQELSTLWEQTSKQ